MDKLKDPIEFDSTPITLADAWAKEQKAKETPKPINPVDKIMFAKSSK